MCRTSDTTPLFSTYTTHMIDHTHTPTHTNHTTAAGSVRGGDGSERRDGAAVLAGAPAVPNGFVLATALALLDSDAVVVAVDDAVVAVAADVDAVLVDAVALVVALSGLANVTESARALRRPLAASDAGALVPLDGRTTGGASASSGSTASR
jgi:hypothetical protein